jgi:hypothetical protein
LASVVYFIRHRDRVKIGFTKHLEQRSRVFRSLLLGEMELLGTIPGARNTERFIHDRLHSHWVEGEWFRDSAELREAIANFIKVPPTISEKAKPLPTFVEFCRKEWPRNRAAGYMEAANCKLETAKRRTSGKHRPGYEEIGALLRSEHGFSFLEHIFADEPPGWFSSFRKAKDIGDMRRQLAEQQRRLTQMEMGLE